MSQTMVSIRMDTELKTSMEAVCHELGMNMTTAFTIFARKVCREHRIPFEVSADPFYSEANQARLKALAARVDSGEARLAEHDLIEVD